jgi:4-amino-4-deoxy-L-arabinose transferase-like glycosyltransferase
MGTITQEIPGTPISKVVLLPPRRCRAVMHALILLVLWLAVFGASLTDPPLLDDADATHAQAAQAILTSSDWVTLHVDGVRYLEKAPLPYWIAALSLRLFGNNAFAIHLPLALTVLGLALVGYVWSRRAFGGRAALYTAIFTLTATGVFLFTRIFIPDALLSLLLLLTLYAMLCSLEPRPGKLHPYLMWVAVALAVLTKGLVALVFFFATALIYLIWTKQLRRLHLLRPFTGILLLLAVAAPWHVLAGLRNNASANGHGFFWFYFVNEHYLRFLGERIPRDYNKLPTALYWSLHFVWLFPWSLFAPPALLVAWRGYGQLQKLHDLDANGERLSRLAMLNRRKRGESLFTTNFAANTVLLLLCFTTLVLVFFSLSTNQEYYTFPAYLPLLMLLAAALAHAAASPRDRTMERALTLSFFALILLGLAIALALAYGLWSARRLPFVPDIGSVLAHRGVGDYTLSMSHFFDLTGPSFAALRLPATLAALTFAIGPAIAWVFFCRRNTHAALLTVAATSAVFLIAAHIALVRFAPMLSSEDFAQKIQTLQHTGAVLPNSEVLIYGDQAFGSSLPFYLQHTVLLVDGRSTSMLFGSTFPDAPPIFLTPAQLLQQWGSGPRKLLFVPLEQRNTVDHLLGTQTVILKESSGKALLTDRPLETGKRKTGN